MRSIQSQSVYVFLTWRIRPGFRYRHPLIHMLWIGLVALFAVAILQSVTGSPSVPNDAIPPGTVPAIVYTPPLAPGVHWWVPPEVRRDPSAFLPGTRYLWIPPTLRPSDARFCEDMNDSYYAQPTAAQQEAWNADCPQG